MRQAFLTDRRIKAKERQLESLKAHAVYTTPQFTDMPHSSASHKSALEETAIKIMELEEYISTQIQSLVELRKEIAQVIKDINNPEYETILEMRYLAFMDWDEISARMNYGGKYVFRVHGRALELIHIPK